MDREITTNVDWMEVDDNGATTGNGYAPHTCDGGYSGREKREGYTTIVTEEETPKTAYVSFVQLPKAEYVAFDRVRYNVAKEGQDNLSITGKTNAPRLGFAIDGTFVELPQTFSINLDGTPTTGQDTDGQVFAGDPGAEAEFAFSILVDVDENTALGKRSCMLTATGTEGVTATTEIRQAGGTSYINVTEQHLATTTVTFDHTGKSSGSASVDINVYSNDNWSIDNIIREWFGIDDHGDNIQDGMITIGSVRRYLGRVQRSETVALITAGGATASVVVQQSGLESIGEIRMENEKGVPVETLHSGEDVYYLVGTANCVMLEAEETSDTEVTDLNDQDGAAQTGGFVVTENAGLGASHSGIALGTALTEQGLQDYGASGVYMFRIPVTVEANEGSSARTVQFDVSNGDAVTQRFRIMQEAAPQSEENA